VNAAKIEAPWKSCESDGDALACMSSRDACAVHTVGARCITAHVGHVYRENVSEST
jgi:hypothetical protein